jgi:hypothetical protein
VSDTKSGAQRTSIESGILLPSPNNPAFHDLAMTVATASCLMGAFKRFRPRRISVGKTMQRGSEHFDASRHIGDG